MILGWHLVRVFWTAIAQLVEQRSPKPQVGGSIPSWPEIVMWKDLCVRKIRILSRW